MRAPDHQSPAAAVERLHMRPGPSARLTFAERSRFGRRGRGRRCRSKLWPSTPRPSRRWRPPSPRLHCRTRSALASPRSERHRRAGDDPALHPGRRARSGPDPGWLRHLRTGTGDRVLATRRARRPPPGLSTRAKHLLFGRQQVFDASISLLAAKSNARQRRRTAATAPSTSSAMSASTLRIIGWSASRFWKTLRWRA